MHRIRIVAFVFMFGAACASCPPNVQQLGIDLGACAAGSVPGVLTGLVQQTVNSLLSKPGTPSWGDFSNGTLLSQGINAATCAVSAAVHDLAAKVPKAGEADPAVLDALDLGIAWLDEHKAPVPVPDHVKAAVMARRARKAMLQLGPSVALPAYHVKLDAPTQSAPPLVCTMDQNGVLSCMAASP